MMRRNGAATCTIGSHNNETSVLHTVGNQRSMSATRGEAEWSAASGVYLVFEENEERIDSNVAVRGMLLPIMPWR